jgi:4a-hydroxytetrahydrobiopterin dehydratase
MPKLLLEEEIAQQLLQTPQWRRQEKEIQRKFKFHNFVESMKFVNQVAELAEKIDHHPDILIQWNRVTLTLSTHSAGGLTVLDFELAKRIDALCS